MSHTTCRGCTEMAHTAGEHKATEGVPYECKFPFRSNNNKWQRTSNSPQQSLTASPQSHGGTPSRTVSLGGSMGKALSAERPERVAAIPRSVSSDGRPLDPKRCSILNPPNTAHSILAHWIYHFFVFFFPHTQDFSKLGFLCPFPSHDCGPLLS